LIRKKALLDLVLQDISEFRPGLCKITGCGQGQSGIVVKLDAHGPILALRCDLGFGISRRFGVRRFALRQQCLDQDRGCRQLIIGLELAAKFQQGLTGRLFRVGGMALFDRFFSEIGSRLSRRLSFAQLVADGERLLESFPRPRQVSLLQKGLTESGERICYGVSIIDALREFEGLPITGNSDAQICLVGLQFAEIDQG